MILLKLHLFIQVVLLVIMFYAFSFEDGLVTDPHHLPLLQFIAISRFFYFSAPQVIVTFTHCFLFLYNLYTTI